MSNNKTSFTAVYDAFLNKITDDMFMELTELDTYRILQDLLINAIPQFEFPRVDLTQYTLQEVTSESIYCGAESDYQPVPIFYHEGGEFEVELSQEEIDILAFYMIAGWIDYQLASVENTRMKYSGSDFKFTSQANHMQKLLTLKKDYEREGFHLQRLYKRRKKDDETGIYKSTISEWATIRGSRKDKPKWFS